MTNEEIIIELNRELFSEKAKFKAQEDEAVKYYKWWQEDSDKVKLKDHELKELYNVIQGKDQEICSLKDTNKELNAENSQLSADFEAYKLKSC